MKIKDINVCSRLREERGRLKLPQIQVADLCGVSIKTVGRWESNTPITADKLAILAQHGYDVTYVLTSVRLPAHVSDTDTAMPDRSPAQTSLTEEQRMWLKILDNLTRGNGAVMKEIGMALLGYSQTK